MRYALGERSRAIMEEIPGPSPDDHTSAQTVDEIGQKIRQLAAQRAAERTQRMVTQFEQERGRSEGLAATGLASVISAVQRNQASTVLLRDDSCSELQVWIGPEPAQLALTEEELREIGAPVLGQDRADAALIRAIAGTGAELVLLPDEQPDLAEGIGALLRFTSPS